MKKVIKKNTAPRVLGEQYEALEPRTGVSMNQS